MYSTASDLSEAKLLGSQYTASYSAARSIVKIQFVATMFLTASFATYMVSFILYNPDPFLPQRTSFFSHSAIRYTRLS